MTDFVPEGAIMASVSRDANGTKRILFTDGAGLRKTIRLGDVPVKTAESFRLRVEALNSARITSIPWDTDLATWVKGLPDLTHTKLVKAGLVEPRENAIAVTLGDLLDRFEQTATVKKSTRDAYRQATGSLAKHIGRKTPLTNISPADADRWRKAIVDEGLAGATVAKRVRVAKGIFRKAVKWRLIGSNPLEDVRAGSQANPARSFHVSIDVIESVLVACPDDEWRLIVALARYAGLRCPSEHLRLKWSDVNWEKGRLTVESPKTEGHEGRAVRVVPITPPLRCLLLSQFERADPGAIWVLPRLRSPKVNLRTTFQKLIARAGHKPWPRLFQNLRASCETDWCEKFPAHVVAGWLGHSPLIAAKHYLQIRDAHFDLATGVGPGPAAGMEGGANCGAPKSQNASPHPSARFRTERQNDPERPENTGFLHNDAEACESLQSEEMGPAGFEPATASIMSGEL